MMEKVCYSFGSLLCIFFLTNRPRCSALLLVVASHADYAIMICIWNSKTVSLSIPMAELSCIVSMKTTHRLSHIKFSFAAAHHNYQTVHKIVHLTVLDYVCINDFNHNFFCNWYVTSTWMLILPAFNFWCWYARFIADIYETEEREESKQFINKIRLEFPKVFL